MGDIEQKVSKVARRGLYTRSEKLDLIKETEQKVDLANAETLIEKINKASHYLEKTRKKITPKNKQLLKNIFNVIYSECADKTEAVRIIERITKRL